MISQYAAIIAALVLVCAMGFQLLLAAGLPLGRAAWGGKHVILPTKLRFGSLAAVVILGISGWIVLSRAGVMMPVIESPAIRIATWVFAGYFVLNTLGNIASKSPLERKVMTPQTLILAVCFVIVALS